MRIPRAGRLRIDLQQMPVSFRQRSLLPLCDPANELACQ